MPAYFRDASFLLCGILEQCDSLHCKILWQEVWLFIQKVMLEQVNRVILF